MLYTLILHFWKQNIKHNIKKPQEQIYWDHYILHHSQLQIYGYNICVCVVRLHAMLLKIKSKLS